MTSGGIAGTAGVAVRVGVGVVVGVSVVLGVGVGEGVKEHAASTERAIINVRGGKYLREIDGIILIAFSFQFEKLEVFPRLLIPK